MLKMGGYGVMRIAMPFAPTRVRLRARLARRARSRRYRLRRRDGARSDRPQAARRVLVRRAHGLRHPRDRRGHTGVLGRRDARDGQPRLRGRPAVPSRGLALRPNAHPRARSTSAGSAESCRCGASPSSSAALASLGLPGLSGFPGEFVTVLAGFARFGWWTAVGDDRTRSRGGIQPAGSARLGAGPGWRVRRAAGPVGARDWDSSRRSRSQSSSRRLQPVALLRLSEIGARHARSPRERGSVT